MKECSPLKPGMDRLHSAAIATAVEQAVAGIGSVVPRLPRHPSSSCTDPVKIDHSCLSFETSVGLGRVLYTASIAGQTKHQVLLVDGSVINGNTARGIHNPAKELRKYKKKELRKYKKKIEICTQSPKTRMALF